MTLLLIVDYNVLTNKSLFFERGLFEISIYFVIFILEHSNQPLS